MPIEKQHPHMPEAPGQEPWTKAERLFREEALHMEADPPAGLEAQVFGALDQPVVVASKKMSWLAGGAAIAAAVGLVWWSMPSDAGHVPSVMPHIETAGVPAAFEVDESVPALPQIDSENTTPEPPAKASSGQEAQTRAQGQVSSMEALDASELPSADNLSADRGLSVTGQDPRQEVRKAKVEVHSKH